MKIIVTTRRIQKKKHKKKRINKKWAKLYGFTEYEVQEKGKPIVVGGRGQTATMYVTLYDYEKIMRAADKVCEGTGYCYMFEPQESEDKE